MNYLTIPYTKTTTMYKEDIKVVDCTIRDGGLMNHWKFDDDFVRTIYKSCVEAGVDYMEMGYISSDKYYSREENGPWKFCDEADLRRIVGDNQTALKLSAMIDIGRIDLDSIKPKKESVIDMIRVACYIHQVDKAISYAEHCLDKGYEVCINLMSVSKVIEHDLDEALKDIAQSRVKNFYLVDSFGSLYIEQIETLMKKYTSALPEKTIGIHAHNNMQMAFANTITAIINGARMLDATFMGLGRGAGNCPMELLIAFLKNPKYRLLPILDGIQKKVHPLQSSIQWGYHIPYMISGSMNEHPKDSLEWMDSSHRDDFVSFLRKMHDKEILE
jgi:4-hydroxy 2-oxovalerate aldolase